MFLCIKRVVLLIRKDQATFCSNGSFSYLNHTDRRVTHTYNNPLSSSVFSEEKVKIKRSLTLILICVTWKLLWSSVDRITLAFFLPLSVRKPSEQQQHSAIAYALQLLFLSEQGWCQFYHLQWRILWACSLVQISPLYSSHHRPAGAAGEASLKCDINHCKCIFYELIIFQMSYNFSPIQRTKCNSGFPLHNPLMHLLFAGKALSLRGLRFQMSLCEWEQRRASHVTIAIKQPQPNGGHGHDEGGSIILAL